jgi:hypothetical protein
MLNERIKDLEKTLEINKELISTLMQPKSEDKDKEAFQKLTDENTYLKKRLKQVYSDFDGISTKLLLIEQINADYKMKEHVISRKLEEEIADLTEKMQKRETYMQQKEMKWMQIEEIMMEYAQDDDELQEKFRLLKVNMRHN